MKTMSCKQLGGACDIEFHADTFENIAELSKQHGMDMFEQQDAPHLVAMQKMRELMKDPKAMNTWLESKRKAFESLPEN